MRIVTIAVMAAFGGVIGLGMGFVVYLLVSQMLLATHLWSSDTVMWAIILPVAALFAFGFARQAQKEGGASVLGRSLAGFALGAVAGGLVTLLLAVAAAAIFNISQMEGAYAMGVAFIMMPMGAMIGGVIGAILAMRRARRIA